MSVWQILIHLVPLTTGQNLVRFSTDCASLQIEAKLRAPITLERPRDIGGGLTSAFA